MVCTAILGQSTLQQTLSIEQISVTLSQFPPQIACENREEEA